MKVTTQQVLLGALAPLASAFPAAVIQEYANSPEIQARTHEILERSGGDAAAAQYIFEPVPMFDESQLIDVSDNGPNPWMAPSGNDIRGPCPGLNAFANHGFLPRNGYATITQFIGATTKVVGMGPQLAAFLAVLGASIDGDLVSWSIGGTPPPGVGGPLASQGHGISGSHNKYESDASPTRDDLYESGNNYLTNATHFQKLIDMSPDGEVTLQTLTDFRSFRFDQQIAENPYFFNGPFTGVLVQPAAYTFIYRFMANHSAEFPYGKLTYQNIQDWFAIQGESGSFTAVQGAERIPYNWYRRPAAYPYDNEYFLADAANAIALYPKFANIGGNTGKTNSFAGIDVENLSGGVYNSGDLTKGNNFACLAYQFAAQAKPDLLLGSLTALTNALGPITSALACPQLEGIDESELQQFPGYNKAPANV